MAKGSSDEGACERGRETNLQLVHPVFTFGLLVRTRFGLNCTGALPVDEVLAESEEAAAGPEEEAAAEAVLEAIFASPLVTGVTGLLEAGEMLLLLLSIYGLSIVLKLPKVERSKE